jgi:hypothetical protein
VSFLAHLQGRISREAPGPPRSPNAGGHFGNHWSLQEEFTYALDLCGGTPGSNACGAQTITGTTVGAYSSATEIYAAVGNPNTTTTIACEVIGGSFTHAAATTPGTVNKKQ